MKAVIDQTFQVNQILNIKKEVIQFMSIGRAKIYEMINAYSNYCDQIFPKLIRLSVSRISWVA